MQEPLSPLERRLLGVLVEKALTAATPEPLTLNAVVVGSNQKSNREPLMNVEDPEADDGLEGLQRKGLVVRITGGRAERWRHNLYDAWKVSKPELALIAELLLRGPQTAAEARARASRMESIGPEAATDAIARLAERGLIVWLDPESRRGARLTHGFHRPGEVHAPAASSFAEPPPPAPIAPTALPPSDELALLRAEVAELRSLVMEMRQSLGLAEPTAEDPIAPPPVNQPRMSGTA